MGLRNKYGTDAVFRSGKPIQQIAMPMVRSNWKFWYPPNRG